MGDTQEIKLKNLEDELERLGQELKEFKEKHYRENAELNKKLEEVENKYSKLEVLIAEIKRDINYSATEIKDIKDLTNIQLKEQRAFQNKAFIYVLITLCTALLFLLGAKIGDIAQLFM